LNLSKVVCSWADVRHGFALLGSSCSFSSLPVRHLESAIFAKSSGQRWVSAHLRKNHRDTGGNRFSVGNVCRTTKALTSSLRSPGDACSVHVLLPLACQTRQGQCTAAGIRLHIPSTLCIRAYSARSRVVPNKRFLGKSVPMNSGAESTNCAPTRTCGARSVHTQAAKSVQLMGDVALGQCDALNTRKKKKSVCATNCVLHVRVIEDLPLALVKMESPGFVDSTSALPMLMSRADETSAPGGSPARRNEGVNSQAKASAECAASRLRVQSEGERDHGQFEGPQCQGELKLGVCSAWYQCLPVAFPQVWTAARQ